MHESYARCLSSDGAKVDGASKNEPRKNRINEILFVRRLLISARNDKSFLLTLCKRSLRLVNDCFQAKNNGSKSIFFHLMISKKFHLNRDFSVQLFTYQQP